MIYQKQTVFVILIALLALFGTNAQQNYLNPQCYSSYSDSTPNFVVNFGETFMLPLNSIFFGNNLLITINTTIEGVSVVNPVNQIGTPIPAVQTTSTIVGLSRQSNTSGLQLYSLLEQIPSQVPQPYTYTVRFFQAQNQQTTPDFSNIAVQLNVLNLTFCADITFITNDILAVDCYVNNQTSGFLQTFTYLTTSQDQGQTVYPTMGNSIPYPFFKRTSISYQIDGGYYMLSYVPYGQYMVTDVEYYIDIYRLVPENSNNYPLGYLDTLVPLTSSDFKTMDLQIVQVATVGNTIIVLDLVQGLFSFQYITNSVANLAHVPLLQISKAWGMNVGNVAGLQVLLVAGESYIYEYSWYEFSYTPYLMGQYPLSQWPLNSTVSISFNVDYIIVKYQNGIVDTYQRGNYYVSQEFTNNQFIQLLDTDNIMLYSQNQVVQAQLSQPMLVISGQDQTADNTIIPIQLNAESLNSNQQTVNCQQNMTITFYQDPNNLNVYQTGLNQYQSINQLNDLNSYMLVGNYYYGANLQYQVNSQNQNINVDLFSPKQSKIYGLIDNSIFTQTFNINSTNNFVVQQLSNLSVFTFNCFAYQNQSYWPVCQQQPNYLNLNYAISFFQVGYYNSMAFWLTANNGNVYGYSFQQGKLLFEVYVGFQILDVQISNELLFVLFNQTQSTGPSIPIIGMYSFFNGLQSYGYITPNTVQNFPGASDYIPIQLQASLTDPGVLFILSNNQTTQIMVVQILNGQTNFLYNLVLQTPSNWQNIKMMLSFNSLVVAYDGANGEIQEYNINDFTYLKFMKTYPLYNLAIATPLTCAYSLYNQLIYVQVINQTSSNTQIFVYRPGSLNLNILYTSFNLPQNQLSYLTAGGRGADFLFANSQGQSTFFWIPIEQYILIKSSFNNTNYVNMGDLSISTFNNISLQYKQMVQVSFQNSLTNIFANQQVANSTQTRNLFSINKDENKNTQLLNISFSDAGWFTGSVISYQLACSDDSSNSNTCSQQYQLFNHFNYLNGEIDNSFITNPNDYWFDQINTQLLYILTNNYLYPVQQETLQIAGKPIYLGNNKNQCFQIVPLTQFYTLYNMSVILVVCYNVIEKQYYVLPINYANPEPTPAMAIYLPQINVIGDVQAMDGYLLVQDKGRPQNQIYGSVYVYQINFAFPKTPQIIAQFGSATLGQATVDITSFTIQPTENPNIRVIFLASQAFNLYAVYVNSSNYAQYYTQVQNVQQIVSSNNLILPQNEKLNQIVCFDTKFNSTTQTYNYAILLVTQASSHFEFILKFNNDTNINQRTWNQTTFVRSYSGYGWSYAIPDVQVYNGNPRGFAIGYLLDNQVTIVYYNRQQPNEVGASQIVPITGGYEVFVNNPIFTFQLYVNSSTNQLNILCSDPLGGLQQISYNNNLTLQVNLKTASLSQNLIFYAFNQISPYSSYVTVPISAILNTSTNGDNLWWIAIIIIGGLILIGVLLYFLRKKKMQDLEDEAQVSLQQQNYETK